MVSKKRRQLIKNRFKLIQYIFYGTFLSKNTKKKIYFFFTFTIVHLLFVINMYVCMYTQVFCEILSKTSLS